MVTTTASAASHKWHNHIYHDCAHQQSSTLGRGAKFGGGILNFGREG